MAVAPGITQWLPLPYGGLGEALRDPLGFQLGARERFGDVFRFRIGPIVVHCLYHPDHVRHVLFEQAANYPRGWNYKLLIRLFGPNLVASDGADWRRQRRMAQPAFHRQRLAVYARVMVDATSELLARWQDDADAGRPVDVAAQMQRLALAIASRTLFDRDVSTEADTIGQEFEIVRRYLESRFNHPLTSLPSWLPTPGNRRFKQAMRELNTVVLKLIQDRRREGRDHGDLLSMLVRARDEETGDAMTDVELRTQALTFLIAGHETTATALAWTWYLLGQHDSIRRQVREEAQCTLSQAPTIAEAAQLSLTRRVIEESMRLYSPVWAVSREAAADDEIGGYAIPRGSTILLLPFVTHRHPDVWPEAERFDPSRFEPEQASGRHKGAYFPFLGGPHQCIGNEFAMLEMQLIVALVLRQFDLAPTPNLSIEPEASLTLRPRGCLEMALTRVAPSPQPVLQSGQPFGESA